MPLIKIDAGIGEMTVIEPENLKLKMLVDAIKDHIEIYGLEKLTNFLSNAPTVDDMKKEISQYEETIISKDNRIMELEDLLDDEPEPVLETIDCGIGEINYEANNLQLQDVMENLESALKKTSPNNISKILSEV